jgi:hypothetical protein
MRSFERSANCKRCKEEITATLAREAMQPTGFVAETLRQV